MAFTNLKEISTFKHYLIDLQNTEPRFTYSALIPNYIMPYTPLTSRAAIIVLLVEVYIRALYCGSLGTAISMYILVSWVAECSVILVLQL